jgi:hypothetical protein
VSLTNAFGDSPDEDFETRPSRKRRLLILLWLSLFTLSTTVAANVTLNKGKITEFGQGLYQVKACDQFITIYLDTEYGYNADGTIGSGYSDISGIRIYGLDSVACKGTTLRLKFYPSTGNPMQMYTNSANYACSDTTNCGYAQLVLVDAANSTQATASTNLSLLDYSGANIGKYNDDLALDYDPTSGSYIVTFSYPRASMSLYSKVTLESAANV